MKYPKFINKGSTIGVCAPSDGIAHKDRLNRLDNAKKKLNMLDINILETDSVRKSSKGRSNIASIRAKELESLITNEKVNAIICASGGDFLIEILPYIDFSLFEKNIKWIQGYSDPTGITFVLTTKYNIATIYSHNFLAFGMDEWHNSVQNNFDILNGKNIIQNNFKKYEKESINYITGLEGYNLDTNVEWKTLNNNNIKVEGRLIGGCLDLISDLMGTPYDNINNFLEKYKNDGIIWFFDNAGLSTESLTRTMWRFKEAGYFKYTKAIIWGRSANENSFYDISFRETLEVSLKDLNIPVIYDMDFGHIPPRITLINGSYTHIMFKDNIGFIEFEYK